MVDVWACPTSCNGSNGIYLGIATYGLPRPDIAAQYGHSRFTSSGFTLTMTGLAPGVYFLYVGAHSTVTGQWVQFAWSFTATAHPISWVETPASGASVGQPFALSGWAIDQAAATGTGVDDVDVWAYPNPGSGASAVYWGPTTLGGSRPAVGAQYGAQFTNSGFTLTVTGKAAGSYLMQVGIRSVVTGIAQVADRRS